MNNMKFKLVTPRTAVRGTDFLYKEPGTSNEYPPHILSLRNKKKNTLKPLYNTVRYNTVLDITQFKDGSQKCVDYIEKWP